MKKVLRRLFTLILSPLERGTADYKYNPLGRKILLVMGVIFSGLTSVTLYFLPQLDQPGYIISAIVFGLIALISFVVGMLGTDRAVSTLWGSR